MKLKDLIEIIPYTTVIDTGEYRGMFCEIGFCELNKYVLKIDADCYDEGVIHIELCD